jgi:hypothetical protein
VALHERIDHHEIDLARDDYGFEILAEFSGDSAAALVHDHELAGLHAGCGEPEPAVEF